MAYNKKNKPKRIFPTMECMFEAYLTQQTVTLEPDDIPQTAEPVWILGKKYSALTELEIIRRDILSKLWFTYRKDFVPIGGDGLTSDKGWGCMLRCGQMVLAQALVELHLGKDWFWNSCTRDSTYLKILSRFEDSRDAPYSIHQIAQMGKSEGKEIGQWFGPNTVAQVLKKLVEYDDWNQIEIHVALDNTIVIEDIKKLCGKEISSDCMIWKPLLLLVPLRLGLAEMNPIYLDGLKRCFQLAQSLGVIGGKPNLALYFIGCVGDDVIYLDPHTTQNSGFVKNKATNEQFELDETYHCKYGSRMPMSSIDPSVAVAFFCPTEKDFDDLCQQIRDDLIGPDLIAPLFELSQEKPKQWCGNEENIYLGATAYTALEDLEQQEVNNSDDDFVII